ncbi:MULTISPECIES: zinc ribbon domain-containing protein [Gardnerella]|jgi:hypothetical protein|uniref:Zinc ribbon domain-containing protein n=2 Tax=Gardnerella TaxID=2701 RepID=A0AAP8LSQ1_GARVA|nr:zinc ribbon domain-containing protein [Gardnerella sp. 30-4]EIK78724.1 hypothetical protein CGSMWGv6420B_03239 [Gardnerella vaginalis 6420B]NSX31171.1 zinc ribbon domain-containing protein [Gardnerella vaginalis]RFT30032.1 zinc ribbon domain-containing protein [Bifidobacteriaceae bacterium VN003]RFT34185.1 zinc ribbon domain-containing protein [Bifidobacteriaceae bacterium NR017]RIY30902.1 zinc ribbon domain-containing protein [Bifidobacteriaceae bacterium GH005]
MLCNFCGKENDANSQVCANCGNRLGNPNVQQTVQNTQQPANDTLNSVKDGFKNFNETIDSVIEDSDPELLHKYSLIAYMAASVVAIIAPFLPLITVNCFGLSKSFNFVNNNNTPGDGIFYIIIAIVALVFAFMNKSKIMMIVGGVAAVFMIFEFFHINGKISSLKSQFGGFSMLGSVSYGIGFYLFILSALALLGSSVLYYLCERVLKAEK